MKFDKTDEFATDWKSMPVEHRRIFRALMPRFNAACEAYVADPGRSWPANLRVKPMLKTTGIWEMTWSFSGPDGRATFEFFQVDGETAVRWRRIGRHGIYENP
ncbi:MULTISPECIES: hypothetical protein [Actinoplanes]|uniref:hypothetical protein n=1 Tax=Actinoplanes TaxID=1865 RepID=UPI0005F278E0|nr:MULTISPECIES: hypothetical protein [Actinoplanes]GLY06034.1 hypothetical protein Acsp01_64130 [Actinoplanes sp. NBRC 101535]